MLDTEWRVGWSSRPRGVKSRYETGALVRGEGLGFSGKNLPPVPCDFVPWPSSDASVRQDDLLEELEESSVENMEEETPDEALSVENDAEPGGETFGGDGDDRVRIAG